MNRRNVSTTGVLQQTVLTPIAFSLFGSSHSETGDARAVYTDLVARHGKSTAAQLAASELESELALFKCDAT
jgi:hypothetical protein